MRQRSFSRRSRGQTIIQYVGVLTISALFISGITVYFQRSLKATLKKGQDYAANKMPGVKEYEPYYLNNKSDVKSESGSSVAFTGGDSITSSPYAKSENDFVNIIGAENGAFELPP